MFETLPLILVLLISSVLAVALFRALRLPAMLAYFLVGMALGPHTFGLLPDTEATKEFAEFGIVFLMFSIGLEFSLPQLYAMRKKVLGLGGAQVFITLAIVMRVAKQLLLIYQMTKNFSLKKARVEVNLKILYALNTKTSWCQLPKS